MPVIAVVVARAGSVRLPNKALLPFGGTTLIGYKVRTLLKCRHVAQVVVGSDGDAILAEAERHGALPIRRTPYHCDEKRCSANEMLADMAGKIDGDVDILWAHPTNPLVRAETYDAAIGAYVVGQPEGYDSLMSVTPVQRHAWAANGTPLNFNPWAGRHVFAAELQPIHFQDGAIFIQPRRQMVENSYFYGKRPKLFPVCQWEGVDIDTRADYLAACALWEDEAERCAQ